MFRSIITFTLAIAVLATTLLLPAETHARRCGEKDPETLLTLYKRSGAIYLATYSRTENGGVKEDNENYRITRELRHFSVTTSFKGEVQKSVVLEEENYEYKGDSEEVSEESAGGDEHTDTEAADDEEYEYGRPKLKEGDTVLLFLRTSKEEGSEGKLESVDYRDGIRRIKSEDRQSYESRLNELNVIFNSAGDRDAAIVSWLISAIEDPVTRWDGAFELMMGFSYTDWEEERAKESENSEETEGETEVVGEEYEMEEWERAEQEIYSDRQRYAKLVTDTQKQGLLNLMLNRLPAASENGEEITKSMSEGDNTLLELVKRWGDRRLASALLDQLTMGAGTTYYRYQMMEIVAKSLSDKDLELIVEDYGTHLYMEDNEVIEDNRVGTGAENEKPETDAREDEKPKVTYGERRAEALAKFISAAQILLATEG